MADTLGAMIKRILRITGQNPSKSALSDNDDTQWLADVINDALDRVYSLYPTQIDTDGSITVTPSTRTFTFPADADINEVYSWSWRINQSGGDIAIEQVTKQFIVTQYSNYEAQESDYPQYVYIDGDSIAVYPLLTAGASNLALQFSYPALTAEVSTWAGTFIFEDRSDELNYCERYAKAEYELYKALGQPQKSLMDAEDLWAGLKGKYARLNPVNFRGYRRYGKSSRYPRGFNRNDTY